MNQKSKPAHAHGRTWALAALLTLLVASGYLNYRTGAQQPSSAQELPVVRILSDAPKRTPAPSPTPDATQNFADIAAQRAADRAQELAMLEGVMTDPKSSSEIVAQAQAQKLALITRAQKEDTLETLLRAACGFSQGIVYVTGTSATIIVEADTLEPAQLTQIVDLTAGETGLDAENIKILPRK